MSLNIATQNVRQARLDEIHRGQSASCRFVMLHFLIYLVTQNVTQQYGKCSPKACTLSIMTHLNFPAWLAVEPQPFRWSCSCYVNSVYWRAAFFLRVWLGTECCETRFRRTGRLGMFVLTAGFSSDCFSASSEDGNRWTSANTPAECILHLHRSYITIHGGGVVRLFYIKLANVSR